MHEDAANPTTTEKCLILAVVGVCLLAGGILTVGSFFGSLTKRS